MNIVSLFQSVIPEPLLFNTEGIDVKSGWNSAEFFNDIGTLSSALRSLGIMSGDRALILSGNVAETYIFSLALWSLGAVAVPVSASNGKNGLVDIIRNMTPSCCFYEGELDVEIRAELVDNCKTFVALRKSERRTADGDLSYDELLQQKASVEFLNLSGDHPALIIHTSGSQGRPKEIQLTHQYLFNYFHYHDLVHRQFCDSASVGVLQKPILSIFHPSHLAAYSITLQGFLMRRPTYLLRSFSPHIFLTLLSRLSCRITFLVPSMYAALLQDKETLARCDFSALQLCFSVGEPTSESLAQRVEDTFNAKVFVGYGLSECLPGIAHSWDSLSKRDVVRGSCGKQLFSELKLVDEFGRSGDRGELWLRNPTVHRCYLNETLNAAKFTEDGWIKTGDLFQRDQAGNFFHQGRTDDMFVCNGKNIYPAEMEFALIKHPAVEAACAGPVVNRHGKQVPAVLLQTQLQLEVTQILEFYLQVGPKHAIPQFIETTTALPKLGPGKLDRRACKAALQQSYDVSQASQGHKTA